MIKEESWTKDQGTQGHSLEQNAGVILGEMGDGRSQRDQGQVENLPEVDAFTEVRTKDSRIQGHPMEPNVKDVVWGEMGDKSDQGGVQGHVEETSDENKENRSEQAECLLIARQHPKAEGIYLEGSCEDINMLFTVDTGAVKSIISKRIFDKIPPSKRPVLEKSVHLMSVNGDPLVEFGKALFKIKLHTVELEFEFIVAEIQDAGLLGIDFLMYNRCRVVKVSVGTLET